VLEKREELAHKVTVANRESMTTAHRVTLVVSDESRVEIRLNNVLAIPEIKCNLLLVRTLASNGVSVGFEGNSVKIWTTKGILFGRICGRIYVVELKGSHALAVMDNAMMWHRKLGHASAKKVREVQKNNQRYSKK
jgi:hypothetical protein